jgi:tetraacyldisaccharide 4'-kinase
LGVHASLFRLHRKVIDPSRGGLGLAGLRGVLRVGAAGYRLGVGLRNCLYDRGLKRVHTVDVPVVSVGNLTAGGTGKTPVAAWVARFMVIHSMRPVILSRGYGRHARTGVDDENAMLTAMARDIPVVVDRDRVRGAGRAVREHGANVVILDDGFQHRRIARDVDIALIDALWPFGARHLLPRGLLREPMHELRRADILVVTRANLVSRDRLSAIVAGLGRFAPKTPVVCCRCYAGGLTPVWKTWRGPADGPPIDQGRWGAFCGVGNPEGFRLTLREAGCEPAFLEVFADHEPYKAAQIERVLQWAKRVGCVGVVTTEKDAVKVRAVLERRPVPPVYAVQLEMECTEGLDALTAAILHAIGQAP